MDYDKIFGVDTSGDPVGDTGPAGPPGEREPEVDAGAANTPSGQQTAAAAGAETETPAEVEGAGNEEPGGQTPEEKGTGNAGAGIDPQIREQIAREIRARAAKQLDESIAALGLTNPYTKEPIKNKADYDAYRAKVDEDRRAKLLKKAGMSEEEFAKLAAEQPEIKAQLEEAREAKRQAAAAAMNEQMRQIHELDPEINTIEDLAKMPNYAQFYRFVKQNRLSLVEAYRLANMERLSARTAAATKQAAMNAAQSKAHLEATKARGKGGDVTVVPNDVREYYRMINPKATEAEVKADYAKYLKNLSKGV